MKYISVKSINEQINTDIKQFIEKSEKNYYDQINKIAQNIINSDVPEKPIILVSGPSGSGKTTSALRIEKILTDNGHKAQTISLDNYFLPKDAENMPIDKSGKIDLESPKRLDIDLLHNHITKMINGKYFEIPVFDFKTQTRISSVPFIREKNHVTIIEGIHALNPDVTGNDISEFTTCVYVSVRTRIKNSNGIFLHPRKIRLMRRLIRDKLFRGRKLEDILEMFASVSRGEDLYIMPYKYRANYDIDTFMAFEPSIYKNILLDDLIKIKNSTCYNEDCNKIITILSEISTIPHETVSDLSLIREFIGGSSLV